MIDKINALFESFTKELETCSKQADVLGLKANYLGKKGSLSEILKSGILITWNWNSLKNHEKCSKA